MAAPVGSEGALRLPEKDERPSIRSQSAEPVAGTDTDILSGIQAMAYRCMPDDRYSFGYAGHGAAAICGCQPEELVRNPEHDLFSLIDPEDLDKVEDILWKTRRSGSSYVMQYRIIHRSGHAVRVMDKGRHTWNTAGEYTGTEGIMFLLSTEEEKAEEAEVPADNHTNSAATYKLRTYPDGREEFIYIKGGTTALFGVSEQELLNDPQLRFKHIHPDDWPAIRHDVEESNKTCNPLLIEYRLMHHGPDNPVWVRGTGIGRRLSDGSIIRTGTVIDVTEIKKTEQSLRLSNERFLYASRATRDAIYDYDILNGTITWTKEYELHFGHPVNPDGTDVMYLAEYVHPDDRQNAVQNFDKAIKDGNSTWREEYRFRCADGTYKYVFDQGFILRDAARRPYRMIGAMKDITGRKKAEESLLKAKNLFECIQWATSALIQENKTETAITRMLRIIGRGLDIDRAYVFCNEQQDGQQYLSCKYEWRRPGVESRNADGSLDKVPYAELPGLEEMIASRKEFVHHAVLSDDTVSDRLRRHGIVSVLKVPVFRGGEFWGFIGFDVCSGMREWSYNEKSTIQTLANTLGSYLEKIETHDRLTYSVTQLSATLEATEDGILLVDGNGAIQSFNKKFARLWGLPEETISRRSNISILQDSAHELIDPENYLEKLNEIFRVENTCSLDLLNFKDGRTFERYSQPVEMNGQSMGRVLSFRDVTAREQYEEALRAKNRELEKTHAELDRFVYSASHELRAPLLSILGLINIAEIDTAGNARLAEYYEMMRSCINRLDNFIQNIINYSRNSRSASACEAINFDSIFTEVMNSLRYVSGADKVNCRFEVRGDDAFYSDPSSLKVIVTNLVSNAVQYRSLTQTQPFVRVSVDITKNSAEIQVEDNGEGIPTEYQSKIFQMFYRVSPRSNGSGLGLYIVSEIVEKLKGNLDLESIPGSGSLFRIMLPNAREEQGSIAGG